MDNNNTDDPSLKNNNTVSTGTPRLETSRSRSVNGQDVPVNDEPIKSTPGNSSSERTLNLQGHEIPFSVANGKISLDPSILKALPNLKNIFGNGGITLDALLKLDKNLLSNNKTLDETLGNSVNVSDVIEKNAQRGERGVTTDVQEWTKRRGETQKPGDTSNMLGERAMDRGSFMDDALSGRIDPLAIDLNGDGVKVNALKNDKFPFKMEGRTPSEWLDGKDGWLVLDGAGKDGKKNGTIDGVDEMFGNFGEGRYYENGFDRLKEIGDSNKDKKFDAKDELFTAVRVWQDSNNSGVTDKGELKTLSDLGITSIDLNYKKNNPEKLKKGQYPEESSFMGANNKKGQVADVWLKVANMTDGIDNTSLKPNTTPGNLRGTIPEVLPNPAGIDAVTDLPSKLTTLQDNLNTNFNNNPLTAA